MATEEVHLSPRRRFTAWWARIPGTGWSILLYLALAGGLALGSALLLRRAVEREEDGWRKEWLFELGAAMLSSAITALAALAVTAWALRRYFRKRAEQRQAESLYAESRRVRSLTVGRLRIPHLFVVASCAKGTDLSNHVRFEFAPLRADRRPDPDEWQALEQHRLPELRELAEQRNVLFVDDEAVDLRYAGVSAETVTPTGGRVRTYRLEASRTNYYRFAAMSADLDRPPAGPLATAFGGPQSLRERWAVTPQRIEDVSKLPAPAKVGVGTAVITADDRLVLGYRGLTYIVGGDAHDGQGDARPPVHIVAEGMIPDDTEMGRLSPEVTARRGLYEELGIGHGPDSLAAQLEVRATGVFFDTLRWQPCFAYLVKIDRTFDELESMVVSAPDFWETDRLTSIPFDIDNPAVRQLMLGSHPEFRLASNHAAAVVYFALLHEFGFNAVRASLATYVRTREV